MNGVGFVGGTEYHPVAEIQGQHFGLVVAKRRNERSSALRRCNHRRPSLADYVHAVVIARSVFTGCHKSLRLVGPEDEQIVLRSVSLGFVEATQGVIVKKQLEERVHITPLGLKLLRHGGEDDFALVNRGEVEGAFAGAKNLGHFGRQEVLQIVADGFSDPAKLFSRLGEKTVEKVCVNGGTAWGFEEIFEILHFFFEQVTIGQQFIRSEQCYGAVQFKEHFERVRNVGLCLAFEKTFVAALAETRRGVHDELCVGGKRNAAVAGQVVAIWWRPLRVGIICADLQMNQIMFAFVVSRHRRERFPINALFVNAQPAPCRLVLKNLMHQLVDAGTGFARAGVTGDEPTATKLISLPLQTAESRDAAVAISRNEQEPGCDDRQKNAARRQEVLWMP